MKWCQGSGVEGREQFNTIYIHIYVMYVHSKEQSPAFYNQIVGEYIRYHLP